HSHRHQHDGVSHTHAHVHRSGADHDHLDHRFKQPQFAPGGSRRAFGVGLIHGLAGSAAIALLVLGAIPTATLPMLYLAIFGPGTMAGMAIITAAIGLPVSLTAARLGSFNRAMVAGAGLLSLGFGLLMFYQIGVVDGLLVPGASLTY